MEFAKLLQPLKRAVKPSSDLPRAFLAEFLAMTMFVFIGCGSVAATGEFLVDDARTGIKTDVARVLPIATAFGLAITVLAFGIGPVSGGHINPAVTFSLLLVRKINVCRAVTYWAAQFSGSVFGALLLWAALSSSSYYPLPGTAIPNFKPGVDVVPYVGRPPFKLGANQLNPTINTGNGFVLEVMGTSILIATVLTTAVDNRSLGVVSSLAPIPIGVSIWIVHLVLIPWTGCGINPARTFGPAIVNSFGGGDTWAGWWWIYYLGPMFGSFLTTIIICFFWGGVTPPGTGSAKKVQDVEIGAENADATDVDLDAITI